MPNSEVEEVLTELSLNLSQREGDDRIKYIADWKQADVKVTSLDPFRYFELGDFNPVLRGRFPINCLAWEHDEDGDVSRVMTVFEQRMGHYGIWTPSSNLNALARVAFGRPSFDYFREIHVD